MVTENAKCEKASSMHHMSGSLSGKKLLLLAGADPHRKVVEAAHDLGVYVIVADYLPVEDAPAKQIADEAWQVDVFDVDALVEKIKASNIDGVLNFCLDAPQKPYQQICERLGFPCYGTEAQFDVLSNKNNFKQYCEHHGLLTIPSYSEEQALSGEAPLPLFVKPSDGRGSRGQTICYTSDELQPAIAFAKEVSRNQTVTIEKYFDGAQDFSISCMIINGIPYIIKMGDRYDGSKADGMDRQHICTLSPTVQTEAFMQKTKPRIEKFISDLGIRFGALFLQGFIEDGEVYCYDPGLRLPGSDFDLITRDITGFDPMKSAINFALTGDVESCYGDPRDACMLEGGLGVILSLAVRPGVIARIEGVEAVGNDPRVHGVSIRHKVGDIVEKTGDTNQRLVEFVAYLDGREQLADFLEFVNSHVAAYDAEGADMTISRATYEHGHIAV